MAKYIGQTPKNLTTYPNSFNRQGAFPLEAYSLFYSLESAQEYAQNSPISYVGQVLTVITKTRELCLIDNHNSTPFEDITVTIENKTVSYFACAADGWGFEPCNRYGQLLSDEEKANLPIITSNTAESVDVTYNDVTYNVPFVGFDNSTNEVVFKTADDKVKVVRSPRYIQVATAYVIDNEYGDLKEVGSSPVGDESTIKVSEDGTISLAGIDGLSLKDDKNNTITYQPLLEDGKLIWVERNKTNVDDLASIVDTKLDGIAGKNAISVKSTDDNNKKLLTPEISLTIDSASSSAKGGTAVKLSQSDSGLKAEVDLSAFAKTTDLPDESDFGVLSVIKKDGTAIEVDNTDTQNPVVGLKIAETQGNKVTVTQSNAGLKVEVDQSHNHDGIYKKIQAANSTALTGAQVIGTIAQSTNGDITITSRELSPADLGLTKIMNFLGETTTSIAETSTTNPITIDGKSITAQKGDVVLYSTKEFVWIGTKWAELGDQGSHALKTITITGGEGLTGGGNLEANRTISHAVPTGASASTHKGAGTDTTRQYITGITTDKFGHITGVTSGTEEDQDLSNYKVKQTEYSATGDSNKTITKVTQNANGELTVEYADIDELSADKVLTSAVRPNIDNSYYVPATVNEILEDLTYSINKSKADSIDNTLAIITGSEQLETDLADFPIPVAEQDVFGDGQPVLTTIYNKCISNQQLISSDKTYKLTIYWVDGSGLVSEDPAPEEYTATAEDADYGVVKVEFSTYEGTGGFADSILVSSGPDIQSGAFGTQIDFRYAGAILFEGNNKKYATARIKLTEISAAGLNIETGAERNVINGLAKPFTNDPQHSMPNSYLKIDSDRNLDLSDFAKQGIILGNYLDSYVTGKTDKPIIPITAHAPILFEGLITGTGITLNTGNIDDSDVDGFLPFYLIPGREYDLHIGSLESSCYKATCYEAVNTSFSYGLIFNIADNKIINVCAGVEAPADRPELTSVDEIKLEGDWAEEPYIYITSESCGLGIERGAQVNKIDDVSDNFTIVDKELQLVSIDPTTKIAGTKPATATEDLSLLDFINNQIATEQHTHQITDILDLEHYLIGSNNVSVTLANNVILSDNVNGTDITEYLPYSRLVPGHRYIISYMQDGELVQYISDKCEGADTSLFFYKPDDVDKQESIYITTHNGTYVVLEAGDYNANPVTLRIPAGSVLTIEELIPALDLRAIATADEPGLVKATAPKYDDKGNITNTAEITNKVNVGTDGTMTVNAISVDKLENKDGYTLVLFGGNATN